MSIRPIKDAEFVLLEVQKKIVAQYNDMLNTIAIDKAKDALNIVPADFVKLGGGIIGTTDGDGADKAIDLMGLNASTFRAYNPFMIIQFTGDGLRPVDALGRDTVQILVMITLIDPRDKTGLIRMLRYRQAIKNLFETMSGNRTAQISLSAIETLPYLKGPDFLDKTKERLTWGVGLTFQI